MRKRVPLADNKPRILVLGGRVSDSMPIRALLEQAFEVDIVSSPADAIHSLRQHEYDAVFSDVGDFLPLERGLVGEQAAMVLNTIGEGACVVNEEGRLTWSNNRMRTFTPEVIEKVKQICSQARLIFTKQTSNVSSSTVQRSKKFTFQEKDRYFEVMASPVVDRDERIHRVVAVVWDATSGRRLQRKIDAIDAAGRELARIDGEEIKKLAPGQRLKLLQDKIIRFSKDLMHFDHFAIRLLDRRCNKLEVVISEGLPAEALEIDLYAQPEGNGISGYVAATGRSYICHDTEKDGRYVLGLTHCKSSLTVPLMLFDEVVGVYNVESETVGAFSEDDRQFAEIFGRYVALTLHILDLLVTERFTTSDQITGSVVQEMSQPLNDIVTHSQTLIEEYIGNDSMRKRLNAIVDCVHSIRNTLSDAKAGPKAVIGAGKNDVPTHQDDLVGKRVLVADDEANIRQTIKGILVKHGCICEICKDGYEATMLLETQPFDLVLSDIKMPYRNGYEIFAAAKRVNEHLPVVLMTGFGYDPHHSIVRASQEGLSSVLFKPFEVKHLLAEIRKAMGIDCKTDADSANTGQSESDENESAKRAAADGQPGS